MHLALDIFQGLGIAAAVGVRPFLPTLAVGALAAGDVQIGFKHTDYSFLQSWPFLLAMVLAAVIVSGLERRSAAQDGAQLRPAGVALGLIAAALGALLFAGALAQDHYASWPGWPAGVACAALAFLATRALLARVRSRLAGSDAATLPAFAEGAALALAVLSVVLPGVGVLAVVALGWLVLAGGRREGQKYAGLRILR